MPALAVLALLTAALPPLCLAQSPDDQTRATARQLGEEGAALFAAGDHAGALKKYEVAYALVPVTTLGVRIARSLDKLGKLLAAEAKYRAVLAMDLPANAPAVHVEAKEQARAELAALEKRIPRIVVEPEGDADADGTTIAIDGTDIPRGAWKTKRAVDPGPHRIVLVRGDRQTVKDVRVEEGETLRVGLAAPGAVQPPTAATTAPPAASSPPPASHTEPRPRPPSDDGTRRTVGYVALGVGAAGLVLGAYGGLSALSKKGSLDERCKDGCPPSAFDDLDRYDTARTLSTVGFLVGAAGTTAGVLLLFTDVGKGSSTRTSGYVGPGSVGVRGAF